MVSRRSESEKFISEDDISVAATFGQGGRVWRGHGRQLVQRERSCREHAQASSRLPRISMRFLFHIIQTAVASMKLIFLLLVCEPEMLRDGAVLGRQDPVHAKGLHTRLVRIPRLSLSLRPIPTRTQLDQRERTSQGHLKVKQFQKKNETSILTQIITAILQKNMTFCYFAAKCHVSSSLIELGEVVSNDMILCNYL